MDYQEYMKEGISRHANAALSRTTAGNLVGSYSKSPHKIMTPSRYNKGAFVPPPPTQYQPHPQPQLQPYAPTYVPYVPTYTTTTTANLQEQKQQLGKLKE